MVSPVVDEVAREVTTAKVGKVNVDEQPELAQAFKVMSIPTLAVVKGGKVVKTAVGVRPKADIFKRCSSHKRGAEPLHKSSGDRPLLFVVFPVYSAS